MKKESWLIALAGLGVLAASAGRVALQVDAPVPGLGPAWPLYCGVPFPRGMLEDARRVRVVDESGRAVPVQSRALARWTGSDDIRWLGVDFLGDPAQKHFLEFGPEVSIPASSTDLPALSLVHTEEGLLITTGPARFLLPSRGPLIARAWLDLDKNGNFDDRELILRADRGEPYVVDQNGRTAYCGADPEPDRMDLEPDAEGLRTQGAALHVAVRREGWYATEGDHDRLARHITRLHFYAGQPFVRLEHTLVMSRKTNPSGYVDRYSKEPPIWFRDIGVRFQHALPDVREVRFSDSAENPDSVLQTELAPADRSLFMFQEKAFYFSRMDAQKDCRFVIGRETAAGVETLKEGARCGEWTVIGNGRAGIALAVRDFWQQYPKELQVTSNAVTARLWSGRGGRELDFRLATLLTQWPTNWLNPALHGDYGDAYNSLLKNGPLNYALGLAKTHELLLHLHAADDASAVRTVRSLSRPAVVLADPRWLYRSEAMSPLFPADTNQFAPAEGYMVAFFDQYRQVIGSWGDYGFLEYGNRPHVWYRYLNKPGHPLDGRWMPYLYRYSGLIDYGFSGHLWRMYARSGRRAYLDLAEETNRQRMDIGMVHWDGPGVSYTNANGWMIGKFKGAFAGSYAITPWGPTSVLHHNSGTELRHLYWYYYLRDYRRAHDVAEEYRALVKRLWACGSKGPFTGTRPFATLKNLGTLYQETGDPGILKIGREQLAALVDLESPQGVTPGLATGLGKYTTNIGAVERWYEATGDDLARQSLLRGARTYARTAMGNPPPGYYNIFARVLNRAYRITGDPLYARILKRNMDLAVATYYDFEAGAWRNTLGDGAVSAANSAYPMGDMVIGMDAVTRAGDLGPVPVLQQTGQGRPVLAVFRKLPKRSVVLDVRGRVPLHPRVLTLAGNPVNGVVCEPFREQLYSLEKSDQPCFYEVRLPAALPEGDYLLDAGVGGAPWEVTWTDAPKIVLYAPGGLSEGNGLTWHFRVPRDTAAFTVFHSATVDLRRPDGLRVASAATQTWTTVSVPPGQDGAFWRFSSHHPAFVELRGVPPVLASATNLFFLPDLARIPVAAFGLERDYRFTSEARVFDATNAIFAPGASPGTNPGLGLELNGRRALQIPAGRGTGVPLDARAGTFEFWFLPDWSSVYACRLHYVLSASPWEIILNYQGQRNNLLRIAGVHGRYEHTSGLTLERGRWQHLAWQWQTETNGFLLLEAFVNGRRVGLDRLKLAAGPDAPAGRDGGPLPDPPGQVLLFGHHPYRPATTSSLDGVVDQLRISSVRRYTQDFIPSRDPEADAATLALFRFEGSVDGISGAGGVVSATLLK